MVIQCTANCGRKAALKRPKTGDALCKECFFWAFETEIHETISKSQLFKPGDVVAIGASGGKDSTVLAYVMKVLNKRYNYGLKLVLLSIDEGITGYRDDSLKTVLQNKDDYEMSLKILSYKELYGWTMDEIVAQIGRKNNCTFCGVFRRQALDRGATQLKVNCIATGHNADDIAETVLMNILRGDLARLQRCTSIVTGNDSNSIPRVKPLKYTYEKEIVLYAHYQKLKYFSTECVFAPNAYRGHARTLLKDLEKIRPSVIMDIIHSGETLHINETSKMPTLGTCKNCGYVSSQDICKACFLLEGLNRGLPKIAIGKTSKSKRLLAESTKTFNESMNKPSLSVTEKYNCNKDQDFKQTDGISSNCNNCCKSNHTEPHSRDIKLCTSLVNTQNSGKKIITIKLNKNKKYVDSLVASAIDEEIPKVKIIESKLNVHCIPTISSSTVSSEINVSYSDLQIENNESDLLSKNLDNIALGTPTIDWNKSCGKCDVCNCVTPERHKCALKIFLSSLNIVSTNHNL